MKNAIPFWDSYWLVLYKTTEQFWGFCFSAILPPAHFFLNNWNLVFSQTPLTATLPGSEFPLKNPRFQYYLPYTFSICSTFEIHTAFSSWDIPFKTWNKRNKLHFLNSNKFRGKYIAIFKNFNNIRGRNVFLKYGPGKKVSHCVY